MAGPPYGSTWIPSTSDAGIASLRLEAHKVSESDRLHWDPRHAIAGMPDPEELAPPAVFAHVEELFPTKGGALELACGRGRHAVWLGGRGMTYLGVDVSPVAIGLARSLVEAHGLAERCQFELFDLDSGLPPGDPVDLLFCHLFRKSPSLDEPMIDRVAPGGLLAVASLSVVGSSAPGRFHAPPGELRESFGHLDVIEEGEGNGMAWILARRL